MKLDYRVGSSSNLDCLHLDGSLSSMDLVLT